MRKWLRNPLVECILPSAMFAGMDTAARRICDVRLNCSCGGNRAVTWYIVETKVTARFHTFKSL